MHTEIQTDSEKTKNKKQITEVSGKPAMRERKTFKYGWENGRERIRTLVGESRRLEKVVKL